MTFDSKNPDRLAALRWAGDADRLLPGEDPESKFVEDAAHWAAVYAELVRTKRDMLEAAVGHRRKLKEGRPEIDADIELLTVQADRLQRRLEYWTGRERELSAPAG